MPSVFINSKLIVLQPKRGEPAYHNAAYIFGDMYRSVTGISLSVCYEDDGTSDLIIIGSDAVNDYLMDKMLNGAIGSLDIRYGTDDYCIRSYNIEDRNILILAGGRGRSTVYAVYDFFERRAGCHYFWDGDVIPKSDCISITGLDINEKPRFEYRGLRYFAHRGLKRFQAEHWSLEEWKNEIDWMMKKRLNFFMLRIGMDDLWQRVYPKDIPYPDPNEKSDKAGYEDRSVFWPLEYRGNLRKKILEYAFENDIMHPEDCGTMSHWYSPAPQEFMQSDKLKPTLLGQADDQYMSAETQVWDIRVQSNMDKYMELTDGYVNEFNPNANIFHTIGMAERNMCPDRESNLRLKLFAYRKIAQNLRQHYPNSKLMIASWDFVGWWKSDEVKKLISELDPTRTVILDYTSEIDDPEQSFINWGVVGKFPWIFGLFHAYEPESTLKGPYERSDERLKIAANDPFCQGMVLWPELSHSDPLILEYLAENSWSPLKMTIEEITERFCKRRYGTMGNTMNEIWQKFMPIIKFGDWGGYTERQYGDEEYEKYIKQWDVHREMWANYKMITAQKSDHIIEHYKYKLKEFENLYSIGSDVLRDLSGLPESCWSEKFILRDGIDIARTIIGRIMNILIMKAEVFKADGVTDKIAEIKDVFLNLMSLLAKILGHNEDFSMYSTLQKISDVCPVNKNFEKTLKNNFVNEYCRQYAYEPMRYLYPKECSMAFDELISCTKPDFSDKYENVLINFMNKPLSEMQPINDCSVRILLEKAAHCIDKLKFELI